MDINSEWISVINQSLALISHTQIDSLDDDSSQELIATIKALLPTAIYKVLSERSWKSLLKRTTLSRDAQTRTFKVPNDYVVIVPELSDSGWQHIGDGFEVIDNRDQLNITYLAIPTKISRIPIYITACIADYFAYQIAWPLTGNENIVAMMAQRYASDLQLAFMRDGADTEAKTKVKSWVDER